MPPSDYTTALADLAAESWRFAEECRRLAQRLDAATQRRFESKLAYFSKRLESCLATAGWSFVNLEGQAFELGIAASGINVEDYHPDETLVIDQMLEPVIVGPDGVLRTGKEIVKKAGVGV